MRNDVIEVLLRRLSLRAREVYDEIEKLGLTLMRLPVTC